MNNLKLSIALTLLLGAITATALHTMPGPSPQRGKKQGRDSKRSLWQKKLQEDLTTHLQNHGGKVGLFIKDLSTGESFAYHADENWYLASTVKVPVALEVLRRVDAEEMNLEEMIELREEDLVDGNGPLKSMKPGTALSVRYLIEQMITLSDNTATDALLRRVGVESVNALIGKYAQGFPPVTSLKDVRRHIYSGIHPRAFELSGKSFIELERLRSPEEKIRRLGVLLGETEGHPRGKKLHDSYLAYYEKGLNSGSPRNYSLILEAAWEGDLLKPSTRAFFLETMMKTKTGQQRIRAGLPKPWIFAHKTGTQYLRQGDVGYILNPERPGRKPLIVVAFVKDEADPVKSAKVFAEIARIIAGSGVL